MSSFNDIDITCEQCGEEFRGAVWAAVHAGQDPELRDLLLGGELNMVMCPECSHVAYQDHFVLYQDPAAELVAYVYPAAKLAEADGLKAMMLKGFHEAQAVFQARDRLSYEPVLMFGLESLVEMLQAEENHGEESQIAENICKEHAIPFHKLRPSEARKRGIPRVIPYGLDAPMSSRESILKGLAQLLKINPLLDLYKQLKSQVETDVQWHLTNS